MRQCVIYDEPRIHSREEIGAMQIDRAAQQQIPAAGYKQGRWQSVQVSIDRGERPNLEIGSPWVLQVMTFGPWRIEMSRQPSQSIHRDGIAGPRKIANPLKIPSAAGSGSPSCFSLAATSAVRIASPRTFRRSRCVPACRSSTAPCKPQQNLLRRRETPTSGDSR